VEFLHAISGWQWAAAAAVPATIIALYFLKLRRKPLEVPSTLLWRKSIEDLRVNSLWQRLRQSVLLWLQLAFAALVMVALLRPALHATRTGRHLIFMLDNSASMNATDVAPNRLEAAKRKATEIADQMQSGDAAMVIAFADAARVVCAYTENVPAIKQAIASIRPTSRRTSLREALVIASGLANPQRSGEEDAAAVPAELYLFSDGRFPDVDEIPLGNLNLHYLQIGGAADNVALVALAARRSETGPDRLEAFARLRNFGPQPMQLGAELSIDGQVVGLQRVELPPNGEQPVLFPIPVVESATLAVRLDVSDHLALDNHAWTIVSPPRRVRVLVIGDENPVLKAALQTRPLSTTARIEFHPRQIADQDLATLRDFGQYDLLIFDRCAPRTMPDCNTFLIGVRPPTITAEPTTVPAPIILNWDSLHPVLRFLDLDDVNVVDALAMPLPQGADKLIESDRGALLFALHRGVHTDLVQTFLLLDENGHWHTDWPLKLSFPLYMMNVVHTLGGAETSGETAYAPGDPVSVPIESDADSIRLSYPGGRTERVHRSRLGKFEVLDSDELGVYTADAGEEVRRFAVNLFDEAESAISAVDSVKVGAVDVADTSRDFAARRELWKYAASIAVALLVIEWYVYNRRVYI
jgi:hypothetical protein